mmetsp:Transcript_8359/g.10191  ORF Transcript_8359/g.10191 Transcript_8359/m.10191 type:complete len:123 (-) Transcript_8359:1276-1644(-)
MLGNDLIARLFYIDNTFPAYVNTIIWLELGPPTPTFEILTLNMLNERGKLSWVQSDQIIYAWPLSPTARIWKMTNKSSASLTNLGSSYVASRGTYLVQYQSSTTRAKLSLISSQTDATSLTA